MFIWDWFTGVLGYLGKCENKIQCFAVINRVFFCVFINSIQLLHTVAWVNLATCAVYADVATKFNCSTPSSFCLFFFFFFCFEQYL